MKFAWPYFDGQVRIRLLAVRFPLVFFFNRNNTRKEHAGHAGLGRERREGLGRDETVVRPSLFSRV